MDIRKHGILGKNQERLDLKRVGAVRSEPGEIPTLVETTVSRESRKAITHRSQKPETPAISQKALAAGVFIPKEYYSIGKIKKVTGREGEGILCILLCEGKKVADYADYADGASPDIYFVNKAEEEKFHAFLHENVDRLRLFSRNPYGDQDTNKMDAAYKEAFISGKTTYWKWDNRKHEVSPMSATCSAVENWFSNQFDDIQIIKACRKGIAFVDSSTPNGNYQIVSLPFTAKLKQRIIDEHFNGDASRVIFLNEVYKIIPSHLEAFEMLYAQALKEEKNGTIYFRPKGSKEEGTPYGKWYQQPITKSREDIKNSRQFEGKEIEWRADILKRMRSKAIAADLK